MNAKRFGSLIHPAAAGLFLALSLCNVSDAYAQDKSVEGAKRQTAISWKLVVEPAVPVTQSARLAKEQLNTAGVKTQITGKDVTVEARGSMEQMRAALFNTATPWIDFLGGPIDFTLQLPASGPPITLDLEARVTTGYRWDVVADQASRHAQRGEASFTQRHRGIGAPAVQTIQLSGAKGKAKSVVHLIYHRPFESNAPVQAKLTVTLPKATRLDLTDPAPVELKLPVDSQPAAAPDAVGNPYAQLNPALALPASFDWRTSGIVPAIRDQGACGSCWAFAVVGAMEPVLKWKGSLSADLSEQFLVSCNKDGWSCNGGLFGAHKYHYNVLGTSQTTLGAVLEASKPYTATNGTCTAALSHPYKLSNWGFVSPDGEWGMPTVDQIKTAIQTYGPVSVGVCVDNGWFGYTGGVYSINYNACDGWTNHGVVLVGWDDATSSWILRNSWGSRWGENGYMRIAYDPYGTTSRVGEGASWVAYPASAPPSAVPTLYRPSGNAYTLKPTYSWSRVATAGSYPIEVYDTVAKSTSKVSVQSTSCNTTTNRCSYTQSTALTNGRNYQWRAAAGTGAFSAWMTFTALSGFDSQFNGNTNGWVARTSSPWAATSLVYYTNGLANKWSSSSFNAVFNNFTYTARMKRTEANSMMGTGGWATGLVVRGAVTSFAADNAWNNGYHFLYSQRGLFSVWKSVSGVQSLLKDWTATTAIVRNDWNTLKVIADGSALRFYINNVLVWSGSDTAFASGQVGLEMYRGAAADQLQVDWATLGMSELYKARATVDGNPRDVPTSPTRLQVMQHSP